MATYTAILFDAGSTLWHRRDPVEVWHDGLSAHGIHRSLEQIREANEKTEQVLHPQWDAFESSEVPTELAVLQLFWDRFNKRMLEELGIVDEVDTLIFGVSRWFENSVDLYSETKVVLKELHAQGYRMAIVSNGCNQEQTARRLGIATYFHAIIGSAHVGFKKPAREIFDMALSRLGVGPEQAIMVGDNWEVDVRGAEAAGITGIHIIRGEGRSQDPLVIKDLWGVVDLVRQLT